MANDVVRLGRDDERAIGELLARDPVVNLFLVGFLAVHPVDRSWWYAVGDPEAPRAVALVLPGRLVVPYAPDRADAVQLGIHLAEQHTPSMIVGPREASDAIWSRWTRDRTPRRRYEQRLYVLRTAPSGDDPPGFRTAELAEWAVIARNAARMEIEDIGVDPTQDNPKLHEVVVQERVRAGRTFVIDDAGTLVFQVNAGTVHPSGAQIGGTWVLPTHRGRGIAQAGVAATCRRVLADHPMVTLHVNEANLPAVRVYERVGFDRDAAFRLIVP
ncbi:MAG: GNAT family N-acetyltransferase [Myxococcota bacterium]